MTMWNTRGRDTSCDAATSKWRWLKVGREVTPAKASEDTQVRFLSLSLVSFSFSFSFSYSFFFFYFYIWHMLSIRQGGGVGVPAWEFISTSSPLEHQCRSLQRFCWWHSPSMEHPERQCNTLSMSYILSIVMFKGFVPMLNHILYSDADSIFINLIKM